MKYFVAAALAAVASALDYPGDYCCSLYSSWNYGGSSASVCINADTGSGGKWFNLSDVGFDNILYSYWCGSKVLYEFGWGYQGEYRGQDYGFSGAGSARNPDIWLEPDMWGNGISSVLLKPYDSVKQGAVNLYEFDTCYGQSGYFLSSADPNVSKSYNDSEMWENQNMWYTWVGSA